MPSLHVPFFISPTRFTILSFHFISHSLSNKRWKIPLDYKGPPKANTLPRAQSSRKMVSNNNNNSSVVPSLFWQEWYSRAYSPDLPQRRVFHCSLRQGPSPMTSSSASFDGMPRATPRIQIRPNLTLPWFGAASNAPTLLFSPGAKCQLELKLRRNCAILNSCTCIVLIVSSLVICVFGSWQWPSATPRRLSRNLRSQEHWFQCHYTTVRWSEMGAWTLRIWRIKSTTCPGDNTPTRTG